MRHNDWGTVATFFTADAVRMPPRGAPGTISDTGKAVEIWKRDDDDGEWRMASAIWNSDLAAAPGGVGD